MRKRDNKFMDMAVELAKNSEPAFGIRMACIVAVRGNIVGIGFNQEKSHPFQDRFKRNNKSIFLHAENDAIKNALKNVPVDKLEKATLYVARVKRKPNKDKFYKGCSKPCEGCMEAIINFDISNVFFVNEDGKYERL